MAGMNQHQIALLLCFYSNVQNVNAPNDAQRVTPLSCRKGARLIKSVVASTKVFGKKKILQISALMVAPKQLPWAIPILCFI